jgi:HEAT repeat protein
MAITVRSDPPHPQDPLAACLSALRHQDPATREEAADRCLAFAEALPAAVAQLATAASESDKRVRAKALRALSAFGRQGRAIQGHIRTAVKGASLWDEDEALRSAAAEALIETTPSSRPPIADLLQALNDPEAPIRFSAAQALGERGAETLPAVGMLLQKAVSDPDGGVRLEAAMALYKIDGREDKILPVLIRALRDPDEVRRWIAADCLGEIGPPAREALPTLRELLQHEFKSSLIRKGVALAVQKIEGPQAAAT